MIDDLFQAFDWLIDWFIYLFIDAWDETTDLCKERQVWRNCRTWHHQHHRCGVHWCRDCVGRWMVKYIMVNECLPSKRKFLVVVVQHMSQWLVTLSCRFLEELRFARNDYGQWRSLGLLLNLLRLWWATKFCAFRIVFILVRPSRPDKDLKYSETYLEIIYDL